MSAQQIREHDVRCLAMNALEALGVNGKEPDAKQIMEHAIAQACLELEAVEMLLERDPNSTMVYLVEGIRKRLEFAQHGSDLLATLASEGKTGAA